jgi:hypothetical protein
MKMSKLMKKADTLFQRFEDALERLADKIL